MLKRTVLLPCLFYTFSFSGEILPSDIDTDKRGVALGTFHTFEKAQELISKLPEFDIYIKQTTTTKKPYFVPFALNLEKKDLKLSLTKIREVVPTAYITSDSRVEQLSQDSIIKQENKIENASIAKIVESKKNIPFKELSQDNSDNQEDQIEKVLIAKIIENEKNISIEKSSKENRIDQESSSDKKIVAKIAETKKNIAVKQLPQDNSDNQEDQIEKAVIAKIIETEKNEPIEHSSEDNIIKQENQIDKTLLVKNVETKKSTPKEEVIVLSENSIDEANTDKKAEKIIEKTNFQVDTSMKAITIATFDTLSNSLKNASKLKEYDVLIKAPVISGNDFTIYVTNIDEEEFRYVFEELSTIFSGIEETSQTRINFIHKRYLKGDKFIEASPDIENSVDSGDFVLNLITKLNTDKKNTFQIKYDKAKKLYDLGEYQKALTAFEKLYESNNEHISINFYLARTYYKLGLYEQASAAFERIVILDENHQRARLELALTYMKLNLNDEAIKEFRKVLEDKTIPKNVVLNIQKKIAFIKSKERRHFFNANVNFGVGYDSNVHSISKSDTLYFSGRQFDGVSQGDEISDITYSVGLNGNYVYRVSDNHSIENKLSYTHQFYKKDDLRKGDGSTTVSGKSKQELQIGYYGLYMNSYLSESILSAGLDLFKLNLGKEDYSQSFGGTLTYQSKAFVNTKNMATLKLYQKNYIKKDETGKKELQNLDSYNLQLLLGNNIPTDRFGTFTLLYSHLREFRIDNDKDKSAKKTADKATDTLIVSNKYDLLKDLYLNTTLLYTREQGLDIDTASNFRRKDHVYSATLGLMYRINKKTAFSSDIQRTDKYSNMNEYSYSKYVYGMNLKYFF